jgi:hypothetical protein
VSGVQRAPSPLRPPSHRRPAGRNIHSMPKRSRTRKRRVELAHFARRTFQFSNGQVRRSAKQIYPRIPARKKRGFRHRTLSRSTRRRPACPHKHAVVSSHFLMIVHCVRHFSGSRSGIFGAGAVSAKASWRLRSSASKSFAAPVRWVSGFFLPPSVTGRGPSTPLRGAFLSPGLGWVHCTLSRDSALRNPIALTPALAISQGCCEDPGRGEACRSS